MKRKNVLCCWQKGRVEVLVDVVVVVVVGAAVLAVVPLLLRPQDSI